MKGKSHEGIDEVNLDDSGGEATARTEETLLSTKPVLPGALYAVIVLTLGNLLGFADRAVPAMTKDLLKESLDLTDEETGLGALTFSVTLSIFGLVVGYLSDIEVLPRKALFMMGVFTWTIASCATFFVTNLGGYIATRFFVALGEASFVVVPQAISDFYPAERRGNYLALFYLAIPFGGALGLVTSALCAEAFGWQYAFLFVGMPGFSVLVLLFFMVEPPRGYFDTPTPQAGFLTAIKQLSTNKYYICIVLASILQMFAAGGVGDWLPTFIQRSQEATGIVRIGLIIAAGLATSSVLGSPLGTFFASKLQYVTKNPYFLTVGIGFILSGLFSFGVLMADNLYALGAILFFQFLFDAAAGPCSGTIIMNCVEPHLRGRAYALHVTTIHLLGDSLSPLVIGALSDDTGGLFYAMLVLPCAAVLAGLSMLLAWRLL